MEIKVSNRIEYLDGHRGLAIFIVILFHAYSRWLDFVPYQAMYSEFPIFKYGWVGVQLFFLISGFVILMTLERCDHCTIFLKKRWLRLFPSMLFCSLLIYCTSSLLSERPAGQPNIVSLLPGLTFIEPTWWQIILRTPMKELEGAFWSIYVEVKFYVFIAILYYWKGRNFALVVTVVLFLLSIFFSEFFKNSDWLAFIIKQSSLPNFGWFASGAMFYIYSKEKKLHWFYFALIGALLSSVVTKIELGQMIAGIIVSIFFALSIRIDVLQKILRNKILIFIGFSSYPLYLIHENALIAMISKVGNYLPNCPGLLLPIIPIVTLIFIAFFIAKYIEPTIKGWLEKLI